MRANKCLLHIVLEVFSILEKNKLFKKLPFKIPILIWTEILIEN